MGAIARPLEADPSCEELRQQLSDYLDDELSPAERLALEAHLSRCPECARFAQELAATVRALHRRRLTPLPADLVLCPMPADPE